MPKPQQELTNVTVKEVSLVGEGDNPEAHIALIKNKSMLRRFQDWVKGVKPDAEPIEKFMTTDEILKEDEFYEGFSKVREAFMKSVEYSFWLDFDAMGENLSKSVSEFRDQVTGLIKQFHGEDSKTEKALFAIIDVMAAQAATTSVEKGREDFTKSVQALLTFQVPEEETKTAATSVADSKEGQMAVETVKSLAEIITGLPAEHAEVVKEALGSAKADVDKAKADQVKAEEEAADSDKEKTATADLLIAVTKRLDALESKESRSVYVSKARDISEKSGIDVEETADMLEAAFGVSVETGEKMEKSLRAMAAQAEKGSSLTKEIGSVGLDSAAEAGSAEEKLEEKTREYQKSHPDMDFNAAYVKVCDMNKSLAAEAIAG